MIKPYSDQIEQLMMNLFNNSIYAIHKAKMEKLKPLGKIEILTNKSDSEYVEIFVTDDGIGMLATDLPHIFEPFFTTKGKEGTGFGLTICKLITEKNHNGELSARSVFGKGTTFQIKLPLNLNKKGV